jgi:MFS family permease
MFGFIDQLETPILRNFFGSEFTSFMIIIGPIISSFFALIGGLLCDWIGRKRTVIYGFVTVGLAYALIGIVPGMVISWYFYLIVDSIAWGIFMSTFVLILWGDLSSHGAREKYYVIGSIPFFLTDFIRRLSTPYVGKILPYATFSLASLFLFLAILPLLYAPETLPKKKIRLRRLRKYMEAAKKVKEKYTEKGR